MKLHGSFPSQRPLIITEEDYRKYPQNHAPFVNTVQQSLLENTFCLIGFSGDDPNFLHWIGWIRDKLGKEKSQKIYLVGVFDFSAARIQLLAKRGICVVDFSCCADIDASDHRKALERFFQYLQSRKRDDLRWPVSGSRRLSKYESDPAKAFKDITDEWKDQRMVYPGWLVLPHEKRGFLWERTRIWVERFPGDTELSAGQEVQYLHELIWRLEKCLLPIFVSVANYCEKILGRYWPFPVVISSDKYDYCATDRVFEHLPWGDIRGSWIYT